MPPTERPTEVIPSRSGQVSALASSHAPIIFTDCIGIFGVNPQNGLVHIGLEAFRHMSVDGQSVSDRVVVAHLRMPLVTLRAIKEVIAKIELMLEPAPESAKN